MTSARSDRGLSPLRKKGLRFHGILLSFHLPISEDYSFLIKINLLRAENQWRPPRKEKIIPVEFWGTTWRKGKGLFIPLPPQYYLYTSAAAHPLVGIEKNIANFATQIISPVKEITVGQSTRPAIGPVCDKDARRGKRETNTYLMEVTVWLSSGEN